MYPRPCVYLFRGQAPYLCHFLGVRDPCPSLGLLTWNCHHRSCQPMPFVLTLAPQAWPCGAARTCLAIAATSSKASHLCL